MRVLARIKGYVSVDAILFETAANKNVSNDECSFARCPIESDFGGNLVLKSSNK
jgi:hypothetical protein